MGGNSMNPNSQKESKDMAEVDWQKTAKYWQSKHAETVLKLEKANTKVEQAVMLARGWKQRAERAEAASNVDRAIEQLTSEPNQGNP